MKKRVLLFTILLFSFIMVNASDDFKVDCPAKANALSEITCTLSFKPDGYKLDGFQTNYDISGGSYVSFAKNDNYSELSIKNTGFMISRKNSYSGSGYDTLGVLKIKMPSSGSASISFSNIVIMDSDRNEHDDINDFTKTIKVTDSNNYLKSLTVSEGNLSPSFNKSTFEYSVTNVNAGTITINAETESNTATISGTGTKTLKYGANQFTITVISEANVKRNYKVTVYRSDNRDKTNTLSSLTIDGYNLSPNFDKNVVNYTLKVKKDVTSVKINASLESSKSSFVKNYGPRTVNLKYGENTFQIQVKSESESVKKYTIKITREDDRSSNNYLKSLNVSAGDFKFDKKSLNYSFSVPNETTSLVVVAVAEDSKSKIDGAKTYDLKEGLNKITITVTAENGSVRKYTLQVTRIVKEIKREVNNKLESLDIENYQISFDPENTIYNVTIDNETKLNINYKVQDETSSVVINGNDNLKNGSTIKLTVTGVDGSTKDYIINISKNEETKKDDNTKNNDDNNKVVKVNEDRRLHIIIGVTSFLIIVVIVIFFIIAGVKRSIKKRAALWK